MHTKIASLWRFIRTPVLLASTTVLLISCASKNPLIDEVEQPENKKSVVSAATDEKPVKTIEADKPVPKTKPAVTRTENEPVGENDNELNRQPEGMRKWISKLTPYKVDIQQGNFVSSEMLSKLKPGMTKEQVRFVLGTPLLTDMFHANRWDYLFRLQKPNGALTTNRVTVFSRTIWSIASSTTICRMKHNIFRILPATRFRQKNRRRVQLMSTRHQKRKFQM